MNFGHISYNNNIKELVTGDSTSYVVLCMVYGCVGGVQEAPARRK